MPSLRDTGTRDLIVQRLQQLTPSTKPKWGKFDAGRMLCHLNDALSMGVGDLATAPMNRKALQHFPLKHLIFYVFPFPKNVPTAPELLSSSPTDFESDRQHLFELINRLASTPKGAGPAHPAFGPLTYDEWNHLQGKHIEHHLKQFGC